jgi:hypothetical protein
MERDNFEEKWYLLKIRYALTFSLQKAAQSDMVG